LLLWVERGTTGEEREVTTLQRGDAEKGNGDKEGGEDRA